MCVVSCIVAYEIVLIVKLEEIIVWSRRLIDEGRKGRR